MYVFLDKFFLIFHTILTLFNLFGWIWGNTRVANLFTLILTALSWFVLGIWYGIGYCPLTDWHWNVLRKLGQKNLPSSYIKYLADRITGLDTDATMVKYLTVIFFFAALGISVFMNRSVIGNVYKKVIAYLYA